MIRIDLKKKVIFYVIMIAAILLLIELFSFVAFFFFTGEQFSFSRTGSERSSVGPQTEKTSQILGITYNFLEYLDNVEVRSQKLSFKKWQRAIHN